DGRVVAGAVHPRTHRELIPAGAPGRAGPGARAGVPPAVGVLEDRVEGDEVVDAGREGLRGVPLRPEHDLAGEERERGLDLAVERRRGRAAAGDETGGDGVGASHSTALPNRDETRLVGCGAV